MGGSNALRRDEDDGLILMDLIVKKWNVLGIIFRLPRYVGKSGFPHVVSELR